jgi:hypothetical protein
MSAKQLLEGDSGCLIVIMFGALCLTLIAIAEIVW